MQLESPQFQLAGIAEDDVGVKPRLRVCNTAECSYQQMCTALRPAVNALLQREAQFLLCGAGLGVIIPRRVPTRRFSSTCARRAICGVIEGFIPSKAVRFSAIRS